MGDESWAELARNSREALRLVPATESVAGRQDLSCGDPGPCVNGPDSHQWLISCQEDRS